MPIIVVTVRVLLACLMGGLVGLEREIHGCAAGLRTHILVTIGSALFMLVSIFMPVGFGDLGAVDPSRIAANVVTGIGFLGAGAIIRYGWSIRGLTTAASIWAVAAIGLAVGSGMYIPAAITTTVVLAVLFLSRFEDTMESNMHKEVLTVTISSESIKGFDEVKNIVEVYGGKIRKISSEDVNGGKSRRFILDVMVYYSMRRKDMVSDIAVLSGIQEVNIG
ncbi:MAG: MgtC/SapB family protein [Candidatus Omnitrophica bacterium]|nr:MgtC/SapB family protein [Candidatus Omnitrophota bacterium]MDD4013332.1 MgtC/SapB family protein [Candidatus Omnitrophota bacterium]